MTERFLKRGSRGQIVQFEHHGVTAPTLALALTLCNTYRKITFYRVDQISETLINTGWLDRNTLQKNTHTFFSSQISDFFPFPLLHPPPHSILHNTYLSY